MDFAEKSVEEMAEWLRMEKFSENTVQIFKDNEVDGEAFLLLTDDQIRMLVKALGPQMKLIRKKTLLNTSAHQSLQTCRQSLSPSLESFGISELVAPRIALKAHDENEQEENLILPTEDHESCNTTNEDKVLDDSMYSENYTETAEVTWIESEMIQNKTELENGQVINSLEDTSLIWSEEGDDEALAYDDKQSKRPIPTSAEENENTSHTANQQAYSSVKKFKLDPKATVGNLSTRVASARKQEPPLPMPFDLPRNFQPKIQAGLDENNLTGRARAKFITSIAEAVYRFKSYPTKDEYHHVANQVVKKWPFLDTRTGHGYIVEAIKERMAYLRKPDGLKRGKPKLPQATSTPIRPLMPSCPALLGPTSEDQASHERHLLCLKRECKTVRPNKQVTKELMKRTFSFRRQEILNASVTLPILFGKYPPLKSDDEIIQELDRIMGRKISSEIRGTWGQLQGELINLARRESVDNHWLGAILEDLPSELPESGKSILAVWVLYYLLPDSRARPDHRRVLTLIEDGENIKEAIQAVPTAQPCLLIKGKLEKIEDAFLIIEKDVLTKIKPTDAPLVLLGAFYAFNMHYTEGCKNFYSFFETVFFNKNRPAKKTRLAAILAQLTCIH